jgi:hypothetical protein
MRWMTRDPDFLGGIAASLFEAGAVEAVCCLAFFSGWDLAGFRFRMRWMTRDPDFLGGIFVVFLEGAVVETDGLDGSPDGSSGGAVFLFWEGAPPRSRACK